MNDYLYHYGVKGMKWGVRKQNPNGSLTDRGYSKYYTDGKLNSRGKRAKKEANRVQNYADYNKNGFMYGVSAIGINYSNSF